MLAVTSPGFLVFAALFAGAWYKSRPANRWRWMLAAGILFYLSLDWQGFVVLLASSLLVWACAFRAPAPVHSTSHRKNADNHTSCPPPSLAAAFKPLRSRIETRPSTRTS